MSVFYLGCDVSKGYGDFVLLNKRKEVTESCFQLDDTAEGHQALCAFLKDFYTVQKEGTIYVGLESTGGYENNWLGLFKRLSETCRLKVTRVDPLAVKKYREACKKRTITDAVSAHVIAHYVGAFHEELDFEQDVGFSAMRRRWNFIQLLIKQRTQLSNQLGFLMYQAHPELVSFCRAGVPDWILRLISKYPTAAELARAKTQSLIKIPYLTLGIAATLIKKATTSVAVCLGKTDAITMETMAKQIISLDATIDEQKKNMVKNCQTPEVKLLASIPGIAEYSAIGLMAYIITICRFPNAKKLAAFFGLHPVFKESGDGKTVPRLSKHGHSQPRAILYMAVLTGIVYNPVIKKVYDRCIRNGMVPQAAIGVCMHKLLRIIYGILVSKKPFDPKIDDFYQTRKFTRKPSQNNDKNRRFQNLDPTAPISKRQDKVRSMKQGEAKPQMNSVHKSGVIGSPCNNKNKTHDAHQAINSECGLVQINTIVETILKDV